MKRSLQASLVVVLTTFGCHEAAASTAYGDLNNFDTVNDTGQECHGFEIEIEGARSTDITYTYDWNHYGAPRIREDLSDPANPKVFVRYESAQNPDGTWAAYTAVPPVPLTPTDGHSCTNPAVNDGCEHFGVGYYGRPTAIRYNWLVDGGGVLVQGPAVSVSTPTWSYVAPVAQNPALPPDPIDNPIVEPARVVAAIPAPEVPEPHGRQFGVPSWVKVIKTTTHNANDVALGDLISDDRDGDGLADWQNAEPAEVEYEWRLLQTNDGANAATDEVQGMADDMGDGDENVTRRYEFYAYAGDATTLDGENGEAMCSEVAADGVHGVGRSVEVTDAYGEPYFVNCRAQVVVGEYLGAQMAGFDAAAPLGLVENLQNGDPAVPYTPRTVVVGGNSPYTIEIGGALPQGMSLGDYVDPETGATVFGVLSGTPTKDGTHDFTVTATDADGVTVSRAYTLVVGSGVAPQHLLSVGKTGSGSGTIAGSGIDCGANCSVLLDDGSNVVLGAVPAKGSVFRGWGDDCAGTAACALTLNAEAYVSAIFVQRYTLSVAKTGAGTGTVNGTGIKCGTKCSAKLDAGTAVKLRAIADVGSIFTGWSGACSGTGPCYTTLDASKSVTANFAQRYDISVTTTGLGIVRSTPSGISCGTKCEAGFAAGTSVTLKANPATDHAFLGWSGACSGTARTCIVTLNSNLSVGAEFN